MVERHISRTPVLGRQRQRGPWGLLASQSNHLVSSKFNKRPPSQIARWREIKQDSQPQPWASTFMCTPAHVHVPSHIKARVYTSIHHTHETTILGAEGRWSHSEQSHCKPDSAFHTRRKAMWPLSFQRSIQINRNSWCQRCSAQLSHWRLSSEEVRCL